MLDYSIKTRAVSGGSESLKGFATVNLGGVFKVTDISICYNTEKDQYFIAMPSYKTNKIGEGGNAVRKSYCCPANPEFYKELSERVIDCFLHNEKHYSEVRDGDRMAPPVFSPEVRLFEKEGSTLKGFCSVKFGDSFIVGNIQIHEKEDGTVRVSMPSKKTGNTSHGGKSEYENICFPVTKEFSAQLCDSIRDCYKAEAAVKKQENAKEPTVIEASTPRNRGAKR